MSGKRRTTVDIFILGLFLSLTLLANFFHTETTLQERDDCPACQFQKSSLSTAAVHLAPPVVWLFVARIAPEEDVLFHWDVNHDGSPRGPPVI